MTHVHRRVDVGFLRSLALLPDQTVAPRGWLLDWP